LKPGDVVVGILPGAAEIKVRPAVVIASASYLGERPDVLVGVLTTKIPLRPASTDYVLKD
jgi:mRNA-degrading endonuclease toxin of MazEF toxin-antitoxin module